MKSTLKRWTEAIAQNVVAAIFFLGGTAVVVYLLADAGNRLTVRVWWLAIAVVVLMVLVVSLIWLTARVRGLRTRLSAGALPAVAVAPPAPSHPHQGLLDRMDAMIAQFQGYESHESVSWETGQAYNDLMHEARAVDQLLNLKHLPVATEVAMYSGPPTTETSPRELAGGLRQARIQVARAKN